MHPLLKPHRRAGLCFTSIHLDQISVPPSESQIPNIKRIERRLRYSFTKHPKTFHLRRPKRTPFLGWRDQIAQQHSQTMCGFTPSDAGYDLNLYPNLARYRTPQRDTNDDTTPPTTTYNATPDSMYNNAHHYTPYSCASDSSLPSPPYQPSTLSQIEREDDDDDEEEEEEEEEGEFPFRRPHHHQTTATTTNSSSSNLPPVAKDPALSTVYVRLFASDILMFGDEWRRCPVCLGGRVCLVRGKCVEDGRRVKVLFW